MSDEVKDNAQIIKDIIGTSAAIFGNITTVIINKIIPGDGGILISNTCGPVLTSIFTKIGSELFASKLGNREASRIGYTYGLGLKYIVTRVESGDKQRCDKFFDSIENDRSIAEEILEGILRASQTEYEERKLPYYADLLANINFEENVGQDKACLFIKISQGISYKQMCLLQLLNRHTQIRLDWGNSFNHLEELANFDSLEAMIEELISFNLISAVRTSGLNLSTVSISRFGKDFCNILGLAKLNENDVVKINNELQHVNKIIKRASV